MGKSTINEKIVGVMKTIKNISFMIICLAAILSCDKRTAEERLADYVIENKKS